eukprot:7612423-Alexandrium_andersonii.AAC.1
MSASLVGSEMCIRDSLQVTCGSACRRLRWHMEAGHAHWAGLHEHGFLRPERPRAPTFADSWPHALALPHAACPLMLSVPSSCMCALSLLVLLAVCPA